MVVDKIEHASLYYGLGKRFQTALEWLASADVGALTPGQRVDIDGDNVFATLFEVDTLPPEACKLECHQNYADIQYLLSGMEGAGYALPDAELHALSEYDPKGDIQFYTAEWDTLTIRPGTFYIVWPQDLHAPRVALGQPGPVRAGLCLCGSGDHAHRGAGLHRTGEALWLENRQVRQCGREAPV